MQRKTWALSIALLAGVVATDAALSRRSHAVARAGAGGQAADCLGPDSIVQIAPTHIGALPLNLSLAELRRRCANLGWTTTNGDETLDTAILLTRPGLRVVGVVANLASEEGDRRPLQVDSGVRVALWKVSGTGAVLPDGVPLTAKWEDLRRAYGPLSANALNGIVYVGFCRRPGIGVLMKLTHFDAPINAVNGEPPNPAVVDSAMAGTPIDVVEVAPSLMRLNPSC